MSYYLPSKDMDIGAAAIQMQQMSSDELRQLLNEDDNPKLDQMIKECSQIKKLEVDRDLLIAKNKSLAEFNLQREPAYRQARQVLIDAHNDAKCLKEEVDKKKAKLEELSRQTSLDTTLALMQTAAAEAEEESENFASAFLASEVGLESFVKEFIEKKKLAHMRRIKTEKMIELVRSGSNKSHLVQPLRPAPAPPQQMPFAQPLPHQNPAFSSNLPPYPTWPPPMPANQIQLNYPFSRPTYR